jgi:hypothetical protein
MRISRTDKLLKQTREILERYVADETDAALIEISKKAGQRVSRDALDRAFKSHGFDHPSAYFKKPEFETDPVQLHEAKLEKSSDKAAIKNLTERLREAQSRQSVLDAMHAFKAPPKILPQEKKSGLREMAAIVLGSDWHVEETVEPEAVANRNEYNLEIAQRRIERFFNGIIWNVEHHRASKRVSIQDLVLWLGGDLMSGYIHEELVESNALSPTETILWLMPRLRNGISTLLSSLDLRRLEIPCSYGNHGRTGAKPRISTGAQNNYEFLLYHHLANEFRSDSRVNFEITASPHQYVQVYDFMLHFHHGGSVKYSGGIGGLGVPLLKAIPAWDLVKQAHYHHIGHFHQLSDFGRVLVNGSLIGYGPYSQWIRASYEPPQQLMYLLDSKRGKCQTTPIWVGDI